MLYVCELQHNKFKQRIINEKVDTPTTTVYRSVKWLFFFVHGLYSGILENQNVSFRQIWKASSRALGLIILYHERDFFQYLTDQIFSSIYRGCLFRS